MRLPAITQAQVEREEARAFHEALWAAHLTGDVVLVPVGDDTLGTVMQRVSSNHKNFWQRRGYRLQQRAAADRASVAVSLVVLTKNRAEAIA